MMAEMLRLMVLAIFFSPLLQAQGATLHLGKSLQQWESDLDSEVRQVRLLGARSLGEMAIAGYSGSVDALIKAVNHKDSAVRYWAVIALGRVGQKAVPARSSLVAALEDEAPEVRIWSAFALAQIGDLDRAVGVLVRELQNPEKGARLQAVHALDELGTAARPAAQALKKAADDDFDYVQRVARHALWVLGERACPYEECP